MSFRATALPFATALVIALAACGGTDGKGEGSPTMRPGEDCLGCHDGQTATRFTAAGTVYSNASGTAAVSGATVVIAYGSGQSITTTTNSAGNFYFTQAFTYPATVTVTGVGLNMSMPSAGYAGCNYCHTGGSTGRVH